jgi:hypothetical protein
VFLSRKKRVNIKKMFISWALIAHTCTSSYLGAEMGRITSGGQPGQKEVHEIPLN